MDTNIYETLTSGSWENFLFEHYQKDQVHLGEKSHLCKVEKETCFHGIIGDTSY